MPDVTAIVVTYESEDLIIDSITAALSAGIAEVVVWDNSPTDKTRRAVEQFNSEKVRIYSDGINHGFGKAINRALPMIDDSNFILLLNPDCICTPDTIRKLVDTLDQDPALGAVAPRMLYPSGEYGIAGGPFPSVIKELLSALNVDDRLSPRLRSIGLGLFTSKNGASYSATLRPGHPVDVDWISGFCFLLRPGLLQECQGFDEDYFLYFEDVDLCNRILQRGYRLAVVRDAQALHIESSSTGSRGKSSHYFSGLETYWRKQGNIIERGAARLLGRTSCAS